MRTYRYHAIFLLLGATALCAPGVALAKDTAPDSASAALLARLDRLEAEVTQLRADLAAAREQSAATTAHLDAQAQAAKATEVRVAAMEGKPAQISEGFRSGAVTFKIGGYIKTVASISRYSGGEVAPLALGRDFYLPQQIPVGGPRGSTNDEFSAKQSRLFLALSTDVKGHTLKGYVETDFQVASGTQGSERTTNGYNLALRRAYVQFDDLLIGQEWSNFQYVAALPETTDYIGPTEGTVFARQPQVRYSFHLSKAATLSVSAENPQAATATGNNPALVENDDNHVPDFAARLNYAASFGELSLAGLVAPLRVQNGAQKDEVLGWGVSAAGKVPFGPNKLADFRFMATYGQGAGRYLGLNFAPDAILTAATGKLSKVKNLAAFAAVRWPWTPNIRSTVMGSFQTADYPDGFPVGNFVTFNHRAWSLAGNVFWTPAKGFDLGVEYRHGKRELVNGVSGQLDRVELAAKYGF
ncbi:MAG: DcaP family trimeric outer membrane transporter [Sphingomonas sp.]|uniref:DcaP family trimeric outer membrane transporter n=1 Tax=Sphingomonas sp. TaxID=28214 RepID=UPI0035634D81